MAIGFHTFFFVFSIHRLAENLAFPLPCKCNHSPDIQEESNLICYAVLTRDLSAAKSDIFTQTILCKAVSWGPRFVLQLMIPSKSCSSRAVQGWQCVTMEAAEIKLQLTWKACDKGAPQLRYPKLKNLWESCSAPGWYPQFHYCFHWGEWQTLLSEFQWQAWKEVRGFKAPCESSQASLTCRRNEQGRTSCRSQCSVKRSQLWWPHHLQRAAWVPASRNAEFALVEHSKSKQCLWLRRVKQAL